MIAEDCTATATAGSPSKTQNGPVRSRHDRPIPAGTRGACSLQARRGDHRPRLHPCRAAPSPAPKSRPPRSPTCSRRRPACSCPRPPLPPIPSSSPPPPPSSTRAATDDRRDCPTTAASGHAHRSTAIRRRWAGQRSHHHHLRQPRRASRREGRPRARDRHRHRLRRPGGSAVRPRRPPLAGRSPPGARTRCAHRRDPRGVLVRRRRRACRRPGRRRSPRRRLLASPIPRRISHASTG